MREYLPREHAQIKSFALRRLGARETSRHDTVVFERCPICKDDKDWRHRLNVCTGFYWCYRRSCTCRWPTLFHLFTGQSLGEVLRMVVGDSAVTLALLGEADVPEDTYQQLLAVLHPPEALVASPGTRPLPLGYTPLPSDDPAARPVATYARTRGVRAEIVECGYVSPTYGAPWCHRLIFPVRDRAGVLKGSVGRAALREMEPRYYSDVLTENMVWGLNTIVEGDHIALAEGIISALAVPCPCVASLSKQFNPTQAGLIAATKPSSVTVMFDADVAPITLLKVCRLLSVAGVDDVRVGLLHEGDPADNPEATARALHYAIPFDGTGALRVLYHHAHS